MTDQTSITATPATPAPPSAGGVGTSPRRYRRRLANLRNVRTALADVLAGLESGTLSPGVARTMIYGLATFVGVFREEREARALSDVEARLAALERSAGQGGAP